MWLDDVMIGSLMRIIQFGGDSICKRAVCISVVANALELCLYCIKPINTLRPRQNGCHFTDNIFKGIFLNENVWILIKFSLQFVPKGPIYNIPTLVQIMAWRRPGDKPSSEPMVVSLVTHICVTRPQWVNIMLWHWQNIWDWLRRKSDVANEKNIVTMMRFLFHWWNTVWHLQR